MKTLFYLLLTERGKYLNTGIKNKRVIRITKDVTNPESCYNESEEKQGERRKVETGEEKVE